MGVSWEEMCQQVVIDGRPGDVASAALGWTELLKNLRSVKESLEKNATDLGTVWKGPAYDAFKTHVDEIAKSTGRLIDDAEEGDGIVHSLNAAADRLSAAQADFPIPASCVNDVLEARNGHLTIGVGFFEAKVAPDFLGLLDPIAGLADWLNDRTDEAAQVYERVNNQYQGQASTMPGETSALPTQQNPNLETPNLETGGSGGGAGSVPSLPGGPGTGGLPGTTDLPSTTNPDLPSTPDPDLGRDPGTDLPDTTTPGFDDTPPGLDDDQYGSGLASAGPTTTTGTGGLPSTSGLGSGGGLGGSGSVPGGGALGRPVATMMPPMMGGGAAGAGRGGGKLGAGGRLGAGMAPGMLGGAGGAGGRGAGGNRGAGAAAAGARGAVGGRGGLVGAGAGAGYGEDETSRSTWLDEDEDIWGADGDSLPGILR
ncbi:WXG100 family type VII secretion target [Micromonospora sp. NPDC050187]|uniref:WXG100 family type VII secretion target n=1 Tax=Micromonospora sp. NPDC050187 TaxID=3364277 RepID=UPI0037BA0455